MCYCLSRNRVACNVVINKATTDRYASDKPRLVIIYFEHNILYFGNSCGSGKVNTPVNVKCGSLSQYV